MVTALLRWHNCRMEAKENVKYSSDYLQKKWKDECKLEIDGVIIMDQSLRI